MTLLKGARLALAGSILLFVLGFGMGSAAQSMGLSPVVEGLWLVTLAAVVGMFVFSIICVVAQVARLLGRQKEAIDG